MDDIVTFKALQPDQIKDIVKLILKELGDRVNKQLEIKLTCTDEAAALLAKEGFDPQFGARVSQRRFRSPVRRPSAETSDCP